MDIFQLIHFTAHGPMGISDFYLFNIYLLIYFWLCWVLIVARGLSSCGTWAPEHMVRSCGGQ